MVGLYAISSGWFAPNVARTANALMSSGVNSMDLDLVVCWA